MRSANVTPAKSRLELRDAREALRGVRETRRAVRSEFELREIANGTGGTGLVFDGYACVTGAEYDMEDWLGGWTESVERGAFKATLGQSPDVAFLLNHDGMTLARTKPGTLRLSEDMGTPSGLHAEARFDPDNMYVQAMRSAVERGDLDEMSFAFRVVRQEWEEDYTRRSLTELNLDKGDVSLVNYGANPHTAGLVALRSAGVVCRERAVEVLGAGQPDWSRAADVFRALRADSATVLSDDDRATLLQILNLVSAADGAVDVAQPLLAELLDVPDPDDPGDGQLSAGLAVARARLQLAVAGR